MNGRPQGTQFPRVEDVLPEPSYREVVRIRDVGKDPSPEYIQVTAIGLSFGLLNVHNAFLNSYEDFLARCKKH